MEAPPSPVPEERLPISPGFGCAFSIALGLLCASVFAAVLWLHQQGQIVVGGEPYRTTRVWVLRGVEGRGIGVSMTRPLPGATDEEICARTSVSFLFLGETDPAADTDYCECFVRANGGWVLARACPE